MVRLDVDVSSFNDFTKLQLDAIKARGEDTSDIMVNLFKGYKAVTDAQSGQ